MHETGIAQGPSGGMGSRRPPRFAGTPPESKGLREFYVNWNRTVTVNTAGVALPLTTSGL